MKRVYSTKPENKGGFFLLLTILAGLIMVYGYGSILLDCSKISDIVIVSLILLAIGGWIYYFLDEAIWQIFGKEKCECNDMMIIITRQRLLKKRKVIYWNEITNISLYKPNKIWDIISFFTIVGSSQNTILIQYGSKKKYKCGVNLNPIQVQKVIKMLVNQNANINLNKQIDT